MKKEKKNYTRKFETRQSYNKQNSLTTQIGKTIRPKTSKIQQKNKT